MQMQIEEDKKKTMKWKKIKLKDNKQRKTTKNNQKNSTLNYVQVITNNHKRDNSICAKDY